MPVVDLVELHGLAGRLGAPIGRVAQPVGGSPSHGSAYLQLRWRRGLVAPLLLAGLGLCLPLPLMLALAMLAAASIVASTLRDAADVVSHRDLANAAQALWRSLDAEAPL